MNNHTHVLYEQTQTCIHVARDNDTSTTDRKVSLTQLKKFQGPVIAMNVVRIE